jgi:small GTP-binding protein
MSAPTAVTTRKIVLLGDQNVGKTSIVLRYVEGTFSSDVTSTIGAFFLSKKINVSGNSIKLQIWDTAGQERFRAMAPMYYRGADAAVLVVDVTDVNSFVTMKGWVDELHSNNMDKEIVLSIACNKTDLMKRKVPKETVADYAKTVGAQVYDTSAKTGMGITNLFKATCEQLLLRQRKQFFNSNSSRGLRGERDAANERRRVSLKFDTPQRGGQDTGSCC